MSTEIAILLGGGRDDPATLNARTLQRVELAAAEFQRQQFSLIIASGGVSFAADPEIKTTEAALIRNALESRAVPEKSILMEESSTDTLGNLYFSRVEHIDRIGAQSITIITSDFHVPRCRWLAEKVFGPDYKIYVQGSDSKLGSADLERLQELERHIQEIYGRWLNPIADGALEEIREILNSHHPGHASSPDFTKQEFVELLYGKKTG